MSVELPRVSLASLPTPVETESLATPRGRVEISIKRDDISGRQYGGNKVRKLEYLLARARARKAKRIATFGTVASNHALATAIYARQLGFECSCFLANQYRTPACARALNMHVALGTEIIRFGGSRRQRISTLRQHLRGRRVAMIPPGGSSWLGAVGFVAAGLELATQIEAGLLEAPGRIYLANGTMGTAVGLALGLALSRVPSEVHAVRVTEGFVSSPNAMRRLTEKTATLLRARDPSLPHDLASRARYVFREGFLGDGYARPTAAALRAIDIARDELGLTLDATYTGKAMAALLQDIEAGDVKGSVLFWNTYNSRPLDVGAAEPDDTSGIPDAFLRYFY